MEQDRHGSHPSATALKVASAVLTFGAGSLDAICFLALGEVFASVMTGNLVLLGLAGGTLDAAHALAAGLALAGYATGVLLVAGAFHRWTAFGTVHGLALELIVLAAFTGLWAAGSAGSSAASQRALLVLASSAMGMQSAAVTSLRPSHPSTTYLTGTLTHLLTTLPAPVPKTDWSAASRLLMLVGGAAGAALLLRTDPPLAPALPLGAVALVVTTAAYGHRRRRQDGP